MSKEYIITCESTADLTAASAKEAGIPVLQQYFRIGEEHLEDTTEEQAERYQRCLAALRRGVSPVAVKTGFTQYLILVCIAAIVILYFLLRKKKNTEGKSL